MTLARWNSWLQHPAGLAALLILLTMLAYWPALHCGYIWDDDEYVTDNPMLTDNHGLHEIWFSTHTQSQYFPLVYTTFRYERQLWGLNPVGFHLVNILLHGVNAALIWILLRRLLLPGAWLAGAIFALHPVQVETVAWISELKNIESLLFYLLALLAWTKFIDSPGRSGWYFYGLALAAGLLALFAKTTACTLPAAMVLVLWLRRQQLAGSRIIQILPFIVAGLGMGLLTVWWEKHLGDYKESFDLSFSFLQRLLIASRALWFYAGKLAYPVNLMICYPRWQIDTGNPVQYIPGIGCIVVAALAWVWRKKIGNTMIAGLIFFVTALSPMLGFIVEGTFHYTYVADHYQYTATIGLFAIFAAMIFRGLAKTGFWLPAQLVLLLALGCLTWKQCAPYRDQETLWRDTLAKNPDCWVGHLNLGTELFKQGHLDEALEHYQTAVTLHPKGDHEQAGLGTALMEKGLFSEAVQHLEAAVALNPDFFAAQNSLGLAYSKLGDYEQALVHFKLARQIDPGALGVQMNMGNTLLHEGKWEDAVETYQQAAKQFPSEVDPLRHLAGILAARGRYPEAAEISEHAIQLAPNRVDLILALGNIQVQETNYVAAVECYHRALQIEPANAGLHFNLGIVLGLQGRTDAERQELEESLRLKPDFLPAQQQLNVLDSRKAN